MLLQIILTGLNILKIQIIILDKKIKKLNSKNKKI